MRTVRVLVFFAGIVFASIFSLSASADAVLTVVPSSSTVNAGSNLAVDVNISGVTDLYDFQFDLTFNPAVLQATNISEGTFLSSGGSTIFLPGTIDNTAGSITFNAITLSGAISGVSGSGTLMEFDFTAFAAGSSSLDLSNIILQDSTGAILNSSSTGSSVNVLGTTKVPEPSDLIMLTLGLLGLAVFILTRPIRERLSI